MDTVTAGIIAVIACLPSAVTGFCFWCLQQRIQKGEKKREEADKERRKKAEEREKLREQQELFLIKGVSAAITLSEATARAVQRIPDANCNGDMTAALKYAADIKHDQRDFLAEQGIHMLYD